MDINNNTLIMKTFTNVTKENSSASIMFTPLIQCMNVYKQDYIINIIFILL